MTIPCSLPNAMKLPVMVRDPSNVSNPSAAIVADADVAAGVVVLGDADQRRGNRAEHVR